MTYMPYNMQRHVSLMKKDLPVFQAFERADSEKNFKLARGAGSAPVHKEP